jgi:RNA polymerase sigma-70 factor (ECF subfamily)
VATPFSDPIPDEQLVQDIAAGRSDALVALFRRRRLEIYRFASHMTGSAAAAEDITQDVFIVVMRQAAAYDPARASATAWLYGIARTLARRKVAREGFLQPLGSGDDEAGTPMMRDDPGETLDRAGRIATLRRAVWALPVRYREVVLLCDIEELSYAEAASALGCAVGTIRSRLHRGRALLAKKLRKAPDGSKPAIAIA